MLSLFIDTNIFLNFYSYSSDYLNKLEQLKALLKAGQSQLFVPTQVVDEFNRNRDNKLKEVLRNLKSFSTELKVPVICQDLAEMKEVQDYLTKLSEARKKLVETVTTQIKSKTLKADRLIKDIFEASKILTVSDALIDTARTRFDLGNPPGKDNSCGDAVNWETLLANVPDKTDLYFVGRDKDYVSVLEPTEFSTFLRDEWRAKKNSDLFFYDLLSKFLKDKFPDFKITDEEVKEEKTIAEQMPSGSLSGSPVSRNFAINQDVFARWAAIDERLKALTDIPELQRRFEDYQRKLDLIYLKKWDEIQRNLGNI